ncbi:MAG TPA: hypothetical protein VI278_14665, partial [Nitrososphaeraceae archaeon]
MREGNYKGIFAYTKPCIIVAIIFVLSSILSIMHFSIISNTLLNNAAFAQSSSLSSSSVAGNNNNNIPSAKSVFDTGTVSLPSSVKGFIISLPDETHEFDSSNRTISHQNAHYLPSNLVIPSTGTAVAF